MLIETNLRLSVLIFDDLDKCVKYNAIILGSVGSDFNPCELQKDTKSLKSDLYARKVLFALEFFKLFKYPHVEFNKQFIHSITNDNN